MFIRMFYFLLPPVSSFWLLWRTWIVILNVSRYWLSIGLLWKEEKESGGRYPLWLWSGDNKTVDRRWSRAGSCDQIVLIWLWSLSGLLGPRSRKGLEYQKKNRNQNTNNNCSLEFGLTCIELKQNHDFPLQSPAKCWEGHRITLVKKNNNNGLLEQTEPLPCLPACGQFVRLCRDALNGAVVAAWPSVPT